MHFAQISDIENVQTINTKKLPFLDVQFLDDNTVVCGGFDLNPTIYQSSGDEWSEVGAVDEEKKKKYDSSLEFDESMPEDRPYKKKEFFEFFSPVFKKNAYFSKKQPTPVLGDEKSTIKQVFKFYDFW